MTDGIFLGALSPVSGTKCKVGRILYAVPDGYQPSDGPGVTVDSLPDPQPPAGMALANTYVDTTTKEVTYDYAAPGDSSGQTYDPTDLASVQAHAIVQINAECSSRIDAGYSSYAEGSKDAAGKPVALLYKSDASHQADMGMELYLAQQHKAGNLAAYPCTWKDASISGPCHAVSDDVIIQLYTEMGVHILWCKTTADTLVVAAQAAETIDAVNAIVWPNEPAPTAPAAA